MKLAQFQAYHIERYYWLRALTEYDAMYWAFYSDWSIPAQLGSAQQSPSR